MTEHGDNAGRTPTALSRYEEMQRPERLPLGVANAVPIGVPLDRETVGRLLKSRTKEVGDVDGRALNEAEEWQILNNAGLGVAPVLWDAQSARTRHLLAAGNGWQTGLLRDTLIKHAEGHPGFWKAAVVELEDEQVRALSVDPSKERDATEPRLLLIVDGPESQEVLSLLRSFVSRASSARSRVHVAVLTRTPAAIPSALMRFFGYRVSFKTTRSDSRDMVGDYSAAALPAMAHFEDAAVVYEEAFAHHPEYGSYREDLPGLRHGRRLDVYVGYPPEGPDEVSGAEGATA